VAQRRRASATIGVERTRELLERERKP
jgi:hypothetical protein